MSPPVLPLRRLRRGPRSAAGGPCVTRHRHGDLGTMVVVGAGCWQTLRSLPHISLQQPGWTNSSGEPWFGKLKRAETPVKWNCFILVQNVHSQTPQCHHVITFTLAATNLSYRLCFSRVNVRKSKGANNDVPGPKYQLKPSPCVLTTGQVPNHGNPEGKQFLQQACENLPGSFPEKASRCRDAALRTPPDKQ